MEDHSYKNTDRIAWEMAVGPLLNRGANQWQLLLSLLWFRWEMRRRTSKLS